MERRRSDPEPLGAFRHGRTSARQKLMATGCLRIARPRDLLDLIKAVARLSRLQGRASPFRAHEVLYHHLDRQKMGDHVAAVVPVVLVWLNGSVGILGTGQQRAFAGLFWR
jgi:hypothetical protein